MGSLSRGDMEAEGRYGSGKAAWSIIFTSGGGDGKSARELASSGSDLGGRVAMRDRACLRPHVDEQYLFSQYMCLS